LGEVDGSNRVQAGRIGKLVQVVWKLMSAKGVTRVIAVSQNRSRSPEEWTSVIIGIDPRAALTPVAGPWQWVVQ
jgi:hypothetical protein